jgi:phosphoglycolate phosphatase-like HAD superfamily hydrolase
MIIKTLIFDLDGTHADCKEYKISSNVSFFWRNK